jgi:hypothetical protein
LGTGIIGLTGSCRVSEPELAISKVRLDPAIRPASKAEKYGETALPTSIGRCLQLQRQPQESAAVALARV